jgi:hypothetical protein
MRNKENIESYIPQIHYSSESVDIRKKCCQYLLENNFHQNKELENLILLEKSLINYSVLKLFDWKLDIDKIKIDDWDNLEVLLETLNKIIPTDSERESFFAQYIHCIIYVYGNIKNDTQIQCTNYNDNISYLCITENKELRDIITNRKIPDYQIALQLLNKMNSLYKDEKNPVLVK